MSGLRSLRGRVAILATLAVAVVLAAVGAVVVASFSQREREDLDRRLLDRPLRALLAPPPGLGPGPPSVAPAPRPLPEGEFARLLDGGEVVAASGAPEELPAPADPGLATVDAGGERYRVLTRERPTGRVVQVGASLAPVDDRVADLRNRVVLISIAGALVSGAVAWWLAGVALRPLAALRAAAGGVSSTRDLSRRLPAGAGPAEVDDLSDTVNAMLGRLERSAAETDEALEATRRFAADAGHELRTPLTSLRANVGALARNPDLPAAERAAILAGAERDAERTVRVLEALQTLARGDAGAALPREPLDLAELADAAVDGARRRHPGTTFELTAPPQRAGIAGWPDGLRVLLDNLLDNAARHGRPGGRVEVTLARDGENLLLTVDDDGSGVSESEREQVFERFARGSGAGEGLGLGLSLVRQQAELHGGHARLERSPLGGARALVTLAAAGSAASA